MVAHLCDVLIHQATLITQEGCHLVVNSPHEVNVERFQSMTSWSNEVEASVDQCVWHLRTMSIDEHYFQC